MDKQAVLWHHPERLATAFILTAMLVSGATQAEPITLSGGLDNRFSDNVNLSSSNETSDIESRVNLRLAHQSDPGKCEANTAADLGYGVWYDNTFDPENYASLSFFGDCELARGLSWQVSDNLRDVPQDAGAGDTPNNRTRKNVFRTGPVYSLRLGQLDRLTFSAQYQNTEFSEPQETDSERSIGSASWNHIFSQTFSGGLQFSTNRAELDTGVEIDTDTASVIFSKSWQATRLSGSIGASELESRFGSTIQTSKGTVGDISLERDINPTTQFFIQGSRELTDQTSDFDIRFGEFVFDLRETSAVEVTALRAGLARKISDGGQLNLTVFGSRSDYLSANEVEDTGGVTLGYSRPLSAVLSFQTQARYRYRTFDQDVDDQTYGADVGLNYRLSEDLGINGRVGHTARKSDLGANEYQENWVSLGLSYQFF